MIPLRRRLYQSFAGFTPRQLFSALQGAWYEPTTDTTYQEHTGLTPGALGSTVGKILDRSGRGYDATQATAANEPLLSARYNLLTKTEDFSDAVWTVGGSGVTPNAVIAPDGTMTGIRLEDSNASTFVSWSQLVTIPASGDDLTYSIYILPGTSPDVRLDLYTTAGVTDQSYIRINPNNGQFIAGNTARYSITASTAGWRKVTLSAKGSTSAICRVYPAGSSASATGTAYVWHPDLRLTSTPASYPAYQRVNTATDYDTAGFPVRLVHDTTDVLTASLPALSGGNYSTSASVYFATNVGMSALHGLTIGTTFNLPALNTDVYGWVITPERLSAVQESRLERYMLRLANLPEPDYLLDSSDNQLTADDGELLLRA